MLISKEILKNGIKHLNGFLPVYKPAGICSHRLTKALEMDLWYVVEKCEIKFSGDFYCNHAIDLEPFADGLMTFVMGCNKQHRKNFVLANYVYKAKIEFGVERQFNTIDGQVLSKTRADHITPNLIQKALPEFVGLITQDRSLSYRLGTEERGVKAIDHTRDIELKPAHLLNSINIAKPTVARPPKTQKYPYKPAPRTMLVESIQLHNYSQPYAELLISCHGCFRVRKFVEDLAYLLGTKASVVEMSRIKEGPITKDDLRVFQIYELNLEYYITRINALEGLYSDFNAEIGPLWEHISTRTTRCWSLAHSRQDESSPPVLP